MSLNPEDPKIIGPWAVQSLNFREPYRRSFRATAGALSADIMLIDAPAGVRTRLSTDVVASKAIVTNELPRALDSSMTSDLQWIASDVVPGRRLKQTLEVNGPLSTQAWAELAKTALVGCAALRAAGISSFQLTDNTFVIDGDEVHMADFWAGRPAHGPFLPDTGRPLNHLVAADDKDAIGRILLVAMGCDADATVPESDEGLRGGFGNAHLDFVRALTSPNPSARPTTEVALRSIPGGDPTWGVPIFALDKPWKPRMKRRAQRGLLWVGVAAAVVGLAVVGLRWLGQSASTDNGAAVASVPTEQSSSATPQGAREIRFSFSKGEAPDQVFAVSPPTEFFFCYQSKDIDRGSSRGVTLEEFAGDTWMRRDDLKPVMAKTSKCPKGTIAIAFTPSVPELETSSAEWTPCQELRVLVPMTGDKGRKAIRICVQQRLLTG